MLAIVTAVVICAYILHVVFLKEGFVDQGVPTAEQTNFIIEAKLVPQGLAMITDDESPSMKVIRTTAGIGQSALQNMKNGQDTGINYNGVINQIRNEYNKDPAISAAYKVYKTVKFPALVLNPSPGLQQKMTDETTAAGILLLNKLHKAMPTYPFSQFAIDKLKIESDKRMPTQAECKRFFKCTTVESLPVE